MRTTLNDPVAVTLLSDAQSGRVVPMQFHWHGRLYAITQVGLHHTYRKGRALIHVFSVADGVTFYRLEMDSETLHWALTEVSDGQPD